MAMTSTSVAATSVVTTDTAIATTVALPIPLLAWPLDGREMPAANPRCV